MRLKENFKDWEYSRENGEQNHWGTSGRAGGVGNQGEGLKHSKGLGSWEGAAQAGLAVGRESSISQQGSEVRPSENSQEFTDLLLERGLGGGISQRGRRKGFVTGTKKQWVTEQGRSGLGKQKSGCRIRSARIGPQKTKKGYVSL